MTVTRGKDNVPSWDGNPASWTEYRKAAFMYEETVKWENRYLCGPRLAAELSGAARAAIANKKRGWLSVQDGVAKLLRCLRTTMSEPALPEISNQLRLYFKVFRRRRGETMAAYCARHREEYARTCKALTRVLREQRTLSRQSHESWRSGRRQSQQSRNQWWNSSSARSSARGGSSDLATGESREALDQEDDENFEDPDDYAGASGSGEHWGRQSWQWRESYDEDWDDEDDDEEDFIEILPDTIKGWLLLERSNLDQLERSLIQSETKNDFSLLTVESALRNQFTDDQIRRKDGDARHSFYGEEEDEADDYWNNEEEDQVLYEQLGPDEIALFQAAKDEEYQAWAMIQQGRQTLREARAKQHDVRLGRKFYDLRNKGGDRGKGKGSYGNPGKGKGSFRDGGAGRGTRTYGPCARCGKEHDTQYCPLKKETEMKTFEAEEQSEFIYGNFDTSEVTDYCWTNLNTDTMTTHQVVKEGFGVLDGGATKTMASITALQHLQEKSRESNCPGIVKVDTNERPTFGFGNSEHNQCVSTCYVKLPVKDQAMSLRVHALDQGSAPVLVSVDTLRKMGAIIDYKKDEAIFTSVNAEKIVKLRRSAAGHQLIPLTSDFLQSGDALKKPVQDLRSLVQE